MQLTRTDPTAIDPSGDTEWSSAALGSVAVSIVILVAVVMYSGLLVIGSSALSLPGESVYREQVATFFPQGWAFFTRSPRTAELLAYNVDTDSGTVESLVMGPNSQAEWSFGLNRAPRTQEFEYTIIAQELSDEEWHSCDGPLSRECVAALALSSMSVVEVEHALPAATICGDVILVRHTAFAWVYANEGFDSDSSLDEIARARVECNG